MVIWIQKGFRVPVPEYPASLVKNGIYFGEPYHKIKISSTIHLWKTPNSYVEVKLGPDGLELGTNGQGWTLMAVVDLCGSL